MRTLVSSIVFHIKGARRASICSWMSGDIGVDAFDPAEHVRGSNWRWSAARCVGRTRFTVALPG
jgi:hypothetical protein